MGDDSNNLVLELVKAQFTCSICYEVMVEPSSIDCGHTFCAYCITNWMKKKASCPLCRTHIKQNTQCKLLDEYLDKIYNQFADEKEKIQRQKFKFERIQVDMENQDARAKRKREEETDFTSSDEDTDDSFTSTDDETSSTSTDDESSSTSTDDETSNTSSDSYWGELLLHQLTR